MKKVVLISTMVLFSLSGVVWAETQGAGYDQAARNNYTENDVASLVYGWFASIDHMPQDINVLKKFLNPNKIDWYFPNIPPIKNMNDFEKWYNDSMLNSIQWHHHTITNLKISGDHKNGFSASFDVNWKATPYKGDKLDLHFHLELAVKTIEGKSLAIEKLNAQMATEKE
jgi:hypothetical protein